MFGYKGNHGTGPTVGYGERVINTGLVTWVLHEMEEDGMKWSVNARVNEVNEWEQSDHAGMACILHATNDCRDKQGWGVHPRDEIT